MAGVSASHLILFIASMIIAASVAGVFTDTVSQLSQAISEQGLDVSSDVRTDVEIISDAGSGAIYDTNAEVITLHVKNTGSETMTPEAQTLDVFVNGSYATDVTVTHVDGANQWRPGDVIRLEIGGSLSSGDHRVKVIVNSDEEVFEFNT